MPVLRCAFRAAGLLVTVALSLTAAPHAAADCTQAQYIDLCTQGNGSAYYPCVCDYDDGWTIAIDGPDIDRPINPPNRPNNSLPGRPGAGAGGGGGGAPIINGGGGRGGGGGRR